jgi:drug/metabolite transporter (DMT)-like permease
MNRRDLLLVLLTGFLAGGLVVVNKQLSLSSSHPVAILTLRCGFSLLIALLVLCILFRTHLRDAFIQLNKNDIQQSILFVFLTFFIGWIMLSLMKDNPASNTAMLCIASGLIFSMILSALLLSERHTKTELIGFGIILIGVITVIKGQ